VPKARVELLGGFAASVDGEAVADGAWRLRKARELVKLLALAPSHRLHREQAMDVLWRDKDPDAAANNLHQAVHAARRALGAGAIELRDELLHLHADVDVERFEQAAVAARRSRTPWAYRAALGLYGGELLPENRYDDWAEHRRTALAELSAALASELAELDGLEGVRGLPVEVTSFVGRERELDELASLLSRTRLLTLTGAGGAGKTRLALKLARSVVQAYEDGGVLVELAPIADPAVVADAAAAALDVHRLPGQGVIEAMGHFLRPRSLLLVLDNCEHVLGASAVLADDLLRAAPRLTIVATSREPLRAPAETVFRVPSLAVPDPARSFASAELLAYESVRLFVERAEAAAPEFELDEGNAADVARICSRLDGLPLALELAAARLGSLGAQTIAERLDDRFRLLRTGSPAAPTRQQTLEATLEWSSELLSTPERILLRRLAVFAGGFELSAVEAVCTGAGLDAPDVTDLLGRLVEKSLVAIEDAGRARRYRLLETVRLYAGKRLDEAGEAERYGRLHAAWALALAERERGSPSLDRESTNLTAALDTLIASDPREALRLGTALGPFWLRRIELEEGHRRLAEALAAAPERTATRASALHAAAMLDLRAGNLARSDGYAQECRAIAEELGCARLEWSALHVLGGNAVSRDDARAAEEWFRQALELARRERFAACEALCVYSLGVARWRLGDLAGAEELLARSIELFRAVDDAGELIPTPISVAEIRSRAAAGSGPRVVFEDTLQPFVEVSCTAAVGYVLANEARLAREQGDFARARALLDESTAVFVREGDERGEADALMRRAHLELAAGAVDAARSCLERALELRRRLRDRRGLGMALSGLGGVDAAAGEHERAEQHLAEARELFRRAGDRWGLTGALWNTADLAAARGDLDAASDALEEALAVLREAGRELWIAQTLAQLGELSVRRGEPDRAAALLREAHALYAGRNDDQGAAEIRNQLGALHRGLGGPPAGAAAL